MKSLLKYVAALGGSSLLLLATQLPTQSAPKIERDQYDDSIRASVKLENCSLIGDFAKEFEIMVNIQSCYFSALSKDGVKTAWLEFITNNRSWIEMSRSKKSAGVFITTAGKTTRLKQTAMWDGSATGGGVLEGVQIVVGPNTTAWQLLKGATQVDAKFNKLEYQALISPQESADIKVAMQSIF